MKTNKKLVPLCQIQILLYVACSLFLCLFSFNSKFDQGNCVIVCFKNQLINNMSTCMFNMIISRRMFTWLTVWFLWKVFIHKNRLILNNDPKQRTKYQHVYTPHVTFPPTHQLGSQGKKRAKMLMKSRKNVQKYTNLAALWKSKYSHHFLCLYLDLHHSFCLFYLFRIMSKYKNVNSLKPWENVHEYKPRDYVTTCTEHKLIHA